MEQFNQIKCVIIKDDVLENKSNIYNETFDTEIQDESSAAGYEAVIGILLPFFFYVIYSTEFTKRKSISKTTFKTAINSKIVSRIFIMLILLVIFPLMSFFLISVLTYKMLCYIIIKRKDKYFVGFLDSFDVFWCLEDDSTKSVINVLGIIESKSSEILADNIKSKLKNLIPMNTETQKIFYRRYEEFGFYYWRKFSTIDLKQYVQVIECPFIENEKLKKCDLEGIMSSISNRPLPYDNEGLFQILITRNRIAIDDAKNKNEYGIIFRIHHSVGDGVALTEFLCSTLADEINMKSIDVFKASRDINEDFNSVQVLLNMIQKLWQIPICFIDDLTRVPDENPLHGPCLSGSKIYKWTGSDENLYNKIRDIKTNVDGLRFSDVLVTSLSCGLNNLLSKKTTTVPEEVAVIVPVRLPNSTKSDESLTNDFSVTILDLPIEYSDIRNVQRSCNRIRRSADPLTNYYLLKVLCGILPKNMLQPLLNTSQATLVFSSMPGPEFLSICGGNAMKSLIFFVPYKGTTGLGVTALYYGGVLRLGAVADKAIVPKVEDLDIILSGMVNKINDLHIKYVNQ